MDMLFFLCLLYIFNSNSTAAPVSTIHDISRDVAVSTCAFADPQHQRTIWNITWSCLTTIFACTWVSIHPNIPGPSNTWWMITRQRLMIMFYALIAPEVVMIWAIRQWMGARKIVREMKGKWTKTHGYFVQMGGFVLHRGTEREILSFDRLQGLVKKHYVASPKITEEEIRDKSKGDTLAKGLVILQTSWFVTQCTARAVQGLVVTELELVTLGFAVLNGMTYFFWWNKPLDVQFSVPVYLRGFEGQPVVGNTRRLLAGYQSGESSRWVSRGANSVADIWFSISKSISESMKHLGADLRRKGVLWTIWKRWLYGPVARVLQPLDDMLSCAVIADRLRQVPTFYAEYLPWQERRGVSLTSLLAGIVFGGIHCVAWSFKFPSHTEQILWRTSSLIVTAVPALFVLAFVVPDFNLIAGMLDMLTFLGIVLYIPARLALLVQALASLRALPPGTFQAVEWTSFIPHL